MVICRDICTGEKHSAEVLPSIPKCKKVVMCLMENIQVFDKLHSGMSYGTVGHEFNVTESTNMC